MHETAQQDLLAELHAAQQIPRILGQYELLRHQYPKPRQLSDQMHKARERLAPR